MELKMEFDIIYIHNFCFKKFGRIKFYVCLMNKLFDLMRLCNVIHNNFNSMIWLFYGNVRTNHNSVAQVVVVAAVVVVVVVVVGVVIVVVNDIVFAQARFYISILYYNTESITNQTVACVSWNVKLILNHLLYCTVASYPLSMMVTMVGFC